MYVILNVHHDDVAKDGGWLNVGSDDIDPIEYKYELVWKTIANRFKNYDEHLIFESMNEVSCMDYDESMKNSADATNFDRPIIMNFNQLFVNAVRSTGSNNTKRWLTAVDHYASTGTASDFKMPIDYYNKDNPRLMFAAHSLQIHHGRMLKLQRWFHSYRVCTRSLAHIIQCILVNTVRETRN